MGSRKTSRTSYGDQLIYTTDLTAYTKELAPTEPQKRGLSTPRSGEPTKEKLRSMAKKAARRQKYTDKQAALTRPPFPFMCLPVELRLQVYDHYLYDGNRHCFQDKDQVMQSLSYFQPVHRNMYHEKRRYSSPEFKRHGNIGVGMLCKVQGGDDVFDYYVKHRLLVHIRGLQKLEDWAATRLDDGFNSISKIYVALQGYIQVPGKRSRCADLVEFTGAAIRIQIVHDGQRIAIHSKFKPTWQLKHYLTRRVNFLGGFWGTHGSKGFSGFHISTVIRRWLERDRFEFVYDGVLPEKNIKTTKNGVTKSAWRWKIGRFVRNSLEHEDFEYKHLVCTIDWPKSSPSPVNACESHFTQLFIGK